LMAAERKRRRGLLGKPLRYWRQSGLKGCQNVAGLPMETCVDGFPDLFCEKFVSVFTGGLLSVFPRCQGGGLLVHLYRDGRWHPPASFRHRPVGRAPRLGVWWGPRTSAKAREGRMHRPTPPSRNCRIP
jgi:hypothetical protein